MESPRLSVLSLSLGTLLFSQVAQAEKGLTVMDAVRAALENHPNVVIGKQSLRANRGAIQSAQGAFDWSLSANLGHVQSANGGDINIGSQDFDITNQQDVTSMGAAVSKLLPWGMTVSSGADFSRSQVGQVVTATLGSSNETDTTTPLIGTLFVNITQPLLQGLGSVTTAELRAREAELLAAKDDYQQTINNQLLEVVRAYWSYASSFAFLRAAREAEGRARKLLEDNKKLVRADLRPAAELRQLEANYADVKQALYRAEQALVSARFTLGVAMGIDAKDASALSHPSTKMPQPPEPEAIRITNENIVQSAYKNRTDLLALAKRVSAAKLRLELAENTKIPQLDLSARVQYAGAGADDDYRASSIQNALTSQLGYTASLNLAFLWPPQMNAADGLIAQQAASLRIAQESQRALRQQIGASVYSAIETLKQRARIAYEAKKAESYYKESVSNEEKKLKAGLSTLVSLVLTQERLATAQSNAVAAMQAYADSILSFRYATGALLRKGKAFGQISPSYLLEFPKDSKK